MKMKVILLVILGLLAAVYTTPVYAAGVPPLPHAFYGDLTINDSTAQIGATVEARGEGVITGIEYNPIITTEVGKYGSADPLGVKLIVQGDIVEGAIITFYVNGVSTGQTAEWHSGEVTKLDLTITIVVPIVTTNAATSVGTTTATLNGSLTSLGNASSVEVSFEWGTSTSYGNETNTQTMTSTGSFSAALSSLSASTTYHFRAKAVGEGTSYGTDRTFITTSASAAPPVGGAPPPTYYYVETNLFGTITSFRISSDGKILETIEATSEDGMLAVTILEGTIVLDKDGNPLDSLAMIVDESPPLPPEGAHIIGLAYAFGPDGATFDPPITLSWSYDPDALPEGVAEEDLVIAYYDEETGEWVELDSVVDTENDTITASVGHSGTFAIIGTVMLTAFSASDLSVSPSEVNIGETVTISLLVTNTGSKSGSYTVTLRINGVKEAEKSVTVAAGGSQTVTFSITRREPGSYTVFINGLSGSFTVAPVPGAFLVTNLSITPLEVQPNEVVTITVSVTNTYYRREFYSLVLKINGVKEAEKQAELDAGSSQDVSFSVMREDLGSYTVVINGLSGSFTVVAPVPPAPTPPEPINWPLIGGIIAAVVVVGSLILFLVFRRRGAY